jgi:ABC-type cobalamin/Fe3+-siderophores transport system ATPase subunit
MDVKITLKNYRCFADTNPAGFVLRPGFTAFVGPNNSGKSTLLRFFYEFRTLFQQLAPDAGHITSALCGKVQAFNLAQSIRDLNETFCDLNDRDLEIDFRFTGGNPKKLVLTIARGTNTWRASIDDFPVPNSAVFSGAGVKLDGGSVIGLTSLFDLTTALRDTLYIGAFRNALNVDPKQEYFDVGIGRGFIRQWRSYKTGNIKEQNEIAFRVTEDIRRVFGLNRLEINPAPDDDTLQILVDEGRSYKLEELGSGLTQFILVLINAAFKAPSFILIDEPELNLHPKLQLEFLTTLASYAREGILFATHNIGLARAAAERIYFLRQQPGQGSELEDFETTGHLSEFLGELSYSTYRALGFDRILLVEGRTDVKTAHEFLRKVRKEHEIVVLTLGGAQMICKDAERELSEVMRISNEIAAIIDSERDDAGDPLPKNREEFQKLCNRLGIRCCVLERRAIENYFTEQAIQKVKGDKYAALGPYQTLREVSPAWGKHENWRIAREMTRDELSDTDLGEFFKNL